MPGQSCMSLGRLTVLYGHLEGTEVPFARDPSGYLSIEAGIFRRHGLEVSWQHCQGTEERERRLDDGSAELSLVVGRASLRHFLARRRTRLLGAVMNRCPYLLLVRPDVGEVRALKGETVACREAPLRNAALAEAFKIAGELELGVDVTVCELETDQGAYLKLIEGAVAAALLPRPYGFLAEEKGCKRISDWPDVVDDPLPITIETTARLLERRERDLTTFLNAHREGVAYFKTHREEGIRLLQDGFGHSAFIAAKTFEDYVGYMNETLLVDMKQFEKLLGQVAAELAGGARAIAAQWIIPQALR